MEKEQALNKAQEWANNSYFSEESRKEIQDLLDANDTAEIYERFYKEMEFGTGGIRGILGQGINRLNIYTVRKATQALATELKNSCTKSDIKVAISYDSRMFSDVFAKETASVLAGNGIQSFLFDRLNPVCLLSFATRHLKADAGIMVTASHNPPKYNGYKVYWNDGRQVTSPYDKNIIGHYGNTDYSQISHMDFNEAIEKNIIHMIGSEVENAYRDTVAKAVVNPEMLKEHGDKVKVIFTPIHGTGLHPVKDLFDKVGVSNYEIVKEQEKPDGTFPTVTSPNPENESALKLGVDQMIANKGDIVLGTDPDADRIGIAVAHNGGVKYLNGNQIGTLLLHYTVESLKAQGKLPKRGYAAKTIVTTDLQKAICDKNGIEIFDTLTGFKWLGGIIGDKEQNDPECKFIFAGEESFGYLNHTEVRDKDGVSPCALVAEMTLHYKLQNKTLIDALDDIYMEYGFFHEYLMNLSYEGSDGAKKIGRIMDMFRNFDSKEFAGEAIEKVEDYQNGYAGLPASNVLCYRLSGGNKVLMRPSGTEPKIKFYIMLQENSGTLEENKKIAGDRTEKITKFIDGLAEKA